jgi:hypothetical protein
MRGKRQTVTLKKEKEEKALSDKGRGKQVVLFLSKGS